MNRIWSKEEIQYLKDNYDKMFMVEIAENLGRTYSSVKGKILRLGIRLNESELQFRLRNNYRKRNQFMDMNPNWKGGISENNYHYKKIQTQRHPNRVRARELVLRAIRSGSLIKQPCKVCGDINSQAHHHDYNSPLDVTWLCPMHHRELHCNIGCGIRRSFNLEDHNE